MLVVMSEILHLTAFKEVFKLSVHGFRVLV